MDDELENSSEMMRFGNLSCLEQQQQLLLAAGGSTPPSSLSSIVGRERDIIKEKVKTTERSTRI